MKYSAIFFLSTLYSTLAFSQCDSAPGSVRTNPDSSTGAFVASTAHVDSTVYTSSTVEICDTAEVYGYAEITGNSIISGNARIFSEDSFNPTEIQNSQIQDDAMIFFWSKS